MGDSQLRADSLAALLPSLASAFGCSHFRHHYILKQRVCDRLPALTEALGPQRLLPHLPELLRITADCAAQTSHQALREGARATLTFWSCRWPASETEAACRAAG